jgi:hypothetical protein
LHTNMNIIIKILGVLFILLGVGFIIKPQVIQRLFKFIRKGKRIYMAALLRLVLAVVFLLGAGACRIEWIVAVVGIIFLLSGLLIFIISPEKIRQVLEWLENKPAILFRFLSLVVIAVGAVVIFAV